MDTIAADGKVVRECRPSTDGPLEPTEQAHERRKCDVKDQQSDERRQQSVVEAKGDILRQETERQVFDSTKLGDPQPGHEVQQHGRK